MAVWTNLDVIEEITRRINSPDDFTAFAGVCRVFRLAAKHTASKFNSKLIPRLMLPHDQDHARRFFSLSNGKYRTINLPYGHHCYSSKGWLLLLDHSKNLCLINPVSSSRVLLPRLYNPLDWNSVHNLWEPQSFFINKFVLSVSPSISKDYTLVVIQSLSILEYYRPGFESWIRIECDFGCILFDVIFYQDKLYALGMMGRIIEIDIKSDNTVDRREVVTMSQRLFWMMYESQADDFNFYLVELDGRLLLLCRLCRIDGRRLKQTLKFRVFEVDLNCNELVEIHDLGSRSIFVGDNSSFSVEISDADSNLSGKWKSGGVYSGEPSWVLKPSCIYFTESHRKDDRYDYGWEMGVYNLKTGEYLDLADRELIVHVPRPSVDDSIKCVPIWVEQDLLSQLSGKMQ